MGICNDCLLSGNTTGTSQHIPNTIYQNTYFQSDGYLNNEETVTQEKSIYEKINPSKCNTLYPTEEAVYTSLTEPVYDTI